MIEYDDEIISRELEYAFDESDDTKSSPRPIHCLVDKDGIFSKSFKEFYRYFIADGDDA